MVERPAASTVFKLVVLAAGIGLAHGRAAALPAAPATIVTDRAGADLCAESAGCERLAAANAVLAPSAMPAAAQPARSPWDLTVSGYAYHFRSIRCKSCERTDFVPGIGVQYRLHDNEQSNWSARLVAGLQNDSFRHLGYYAGITGQRVYRAGWGEIEYGIGAFALRRTFSPKGGLEWLYTPLPLVSVRPHDSRWGLNVLAAPNFQHHGKRRSGFVFFQLSYALGA